MHPDILPLHADIEERHWWFVARREIVRALLTAVEPPGREKHVVDLGCGTGGNLGSLDELYRCTGIELDATAVRIARERYPGCRFECASMFEPEDWGLDRPSDVCLMMDVIEHLDDDEGAVSCAVDAIKPGGHLLITVPADPRLWGKHDRHHEHRRRYTRESLARLLEPFPLRVRILSYFNSRLYFPIRAYRWLENHVAVFQDTGTTGNLKAQAPWLNAVLERLFRGELGVLRAALDRPSEGYTRGVSLLALCQKESVA